MKFCYITFRSVTPAQRAEATLRRAGVECSLQRTPKWMEEQGCGYSLRLRCADAPKAVRMLTEQKIAYRKLYASRGGRLEEMTDDLFG